jgi:hypothetical protein
MKRSTKNQIITGISALSIAAIFPLVTGLPVFAQTATAGDKLELTSNKQNAREPQTSAFALVEEAYQGSFKDQGVSGFEMLIQEYEEGETTAKDVVQAGIDAGKLSPDTLNNESYLEAVNTQLRGLVNESR